MRRVLLPALFTAFFIVESIFVEFMPAKIFNSERILIPHLLLIAILLLTIYVNRNIGILYGFIFGLLYDVVYTEIIGIYVAFFPLLAYLAGKLMKILHTNILIGTIVSILGVTLLELGVYELNFIIHQHDMAFTTFINMRLLPTIVFNLVITILVVYPLAKLFEKIADQLRNE